MPLSFATNIVAAYFDTNIGNDPNYESPGNFNIPAVMSGSVGVGSVNITAAGVYTTIPTATASTGGATFQTQMKILSGSTIVAAGTQYAPGDTVHLVGGTATTPVAITVATAKLVSATINAGGTGYGNATTFNVTVVGGTQTSAAVVNVTTNSSGVVTTVNSVGTAGSYTVLPTLTGNAVTGDDGTDHGTGLTLNLVFGVNTYTIATAGVYTAIPANPISTTTTGSGTGLTFTGSWGVTGLIIINPGEYETGAAPTISFSTGAATATATLAATSTTVADQQKVMCLIEIMRAYIAEADSVAQLRDMHEIMRNMMSCIKYGGSASASGNTNNFNASVLATHALKAGMGYFAKNPKRLNVAVSGVVRGLNL